MDKEIVIKAFRFDSTRILEIDQALTGEYYSLCRSLLEDSIDEVKESILQKLYPGEEGIHNAKLEEYNTRLKGYTYFMDEINKEIDEREGIKVQRES